MSALPKVVILAGGLGTRLYPVTKTLPKSLLPIQGEPFISHQLKLLAKHQIKEVVLCIGNLGEKIQDFVGDGHQFGLHVQYSQDSQPFLGTGGAIKKALPLLSDTFFVLYGDAYLLCDYQAVLAAFEKNKKLALMTVFKNNGQWDSSNVEFSQGMIKAYSKTKKTNQMDHIDYGLGVFSKKAFADVPENQAYDLASLYEYWLEKNQLSAYVVKARFYEIGSFSGIDALNSFLLKEEKCHL